MKTYTLHVSGMHCASCIVLTETVIQEHSDIIAAKSSLKQHTVVITSNVGDDDLTEMLEQLNEKLRPHKYVLSMEKKAHRAAWNEFVHALPIALGFLALFVILQKLGIVNLVGAGKVTFGTAFVVGLIASVSTCMAVVGGLVLSLSANFAKEGDELRPQFLFHIGRLLSFFILGGTIGVLGSVFHMGAEGSAFLSVAVGLVMGLLGLNLLDVLPRLKRYQITLPTFFSRHILELKKLNHSLTPFLIGVVTFILPCGFTQSMQLAALSSGSFITGSLVMLSFALGTLPVLALLSFSSFSLAHKMQSGIFYKAAGLIVIAFAFINIVGGLVVLGVIEPILNI